MVDDIRTVLMANIDKVIPKNEDTNVDPGTVEKTEKESESTPDNVTKTSDDKKSDEAQRATKKKHDLQSRIDAKHAEAMQYKDQLAQAMAKLDVYEKQLLNNSKPKDEPKEDELNFSASDDPVGDLEKYLKEKVVTKDTLTSMVQKIIDDRLNVAKESIEKETTAQSMKRITDEFNQKMYDHYADLRDEDGQWPEEVRKEALEVYDLFNSRPQFYLDTVSKHGIGYLKKFINGEFAAEKKADNLRKIIDKADAVRTNTDSSNNVTPYEKPALKKSYREIFQSAFNKIKQT